MGDPRAGWIVTGTGSLTPNDATDWEAALAQLKRVRETTLLPLGLDVKGTLVALGEDDAVLARVRVEGAAVEVHLEAPTDVDVERKAWMNALRGPSAEMRKAAAQHLGAWSDAEVLQALAEAATSDGEVSVRIAAFETLGELGEAAVPVRAKVASCLDDVQPFIRDWATYALGRMGAAAKDALPALQALTSDREDGPRYGALDAIRRIRAAM